MDINELHEKFQEYGKNVKAWMKKCALLLPEIDRQKVWHKKGFNSIYEYAFKLASMSKGQIDDALRILKKIENMPALREVAELKGISAVRPVSTIATKENQKYWAKQALKMSKHELETFVRETRIFQANMQESNFNSVQNIESLYMDLKPETAAKLKKMNNGDWNELMQKFIKLYEEDLEKNKPKPKNKASRTIPARIKKYILKKSHGKCEFPNCHKKYHHLHHTDRFATKHLHDPDKIIALCKSHHSLAHRGLVHNEEKDPKFWTIRQEPDYKSLNRFIDQQVEFYRRS